MKLPRCATQGPRPPAGITRRPPAGITRPAAASGYHPARGRQRVSPGPPRRAASRRVLAALGPAPLRWVRPGPEGCYHGPVVVRVQFILSQGAT